MDSVLNTEDFDLTSPTFSYLLPGRREVKNVNCSLWSKEPAKKSVLSKPAQAKTVSKNKVAKRKRIVSEGSSDEDFVPAAAVSPVAAKNNAKKQEQTTILDSSPEILISDSD